jgi:hypothetical protein
MPINRTSAISKVETMEWSMKRFLSIIGSVGLLLALSNCGGGDDPEDNDAGNQRSVAIACLEPVNTN